MAVDVSYHLWGCTEGRKEGSRRGWGREGGGRAEEWWGEKEGETRERRREEESERRREDKGERVGGRDNQLVCLRECLK